jgi:hypothetical protein
MDGLARVAGKIERQLNIGGKLYTLATPTLAAWAALESQLIQETNDVLDKAAEVAAKVPVEQRAVFWEQAHKLASQRCAITVDEMTHLPPFEQVVIQWFLCLQRHHANEFPTLQSVRTFILNELGDVPLDEMAQYLSHIIEGGLKNSPGPTEGTGSNTSG